MTTRSLCMSLAILLATAGSVDAARKPRGAPFEHTFAVAMVVGDPDIVIGSNGPLGSGRTVFSFARFRPAALAVAHSQQRRRLGDNASDRPNPFQLVDLSSGGATTAPIVPGPLPEEPTLLERAWWRGEQTTTAWTDARRLQNGTIVSGPLQAVATIKADGGTACAFNGTTQYVDIPHVPGLKPEQGGVLLHFQLDTLAAKANMFSGDGAGTAGGISLEVEADGSPRCYLRDGAGTPQILVGPDGTVATATAYAMAMTWGDDGLWGYLWNAGGLVWSANLPAVTAGLVGTSAFRIGSWHAGVVRVDGIISRVTLFGRQPTQAELDDRVVPVTIAH